MHPTFSGSVNDKSCEISRLAIARFRRNQLVATGLYSYMYNAAVSMGIDYFYAILEQPLLRKAWRTGFPFRQLGSKVIYFGALTLPAVAQARHITVNQVYGRMLNKQ